VSRVLAVASAPTLFGRARRGWRLGIARRLAVGSFGGAPGVAAWHREAQS